MPYLHRFTSIFTLRQYQLTLKLHRFTSIFNLHINSIMSPYLQFNPTPKLHHFLVPPMSTLHLNSAASRYLCVCVCVYTVRPYRTHTHTHTHTPQVQNYPAKHRPSTRQNISESLRVISVKHSSVLPDDGSHKIRNMSE
jgi:hypothetical protein